MTVVTCKGDSGHLFLNPHCSYPENKSGFVGDSLFLISERGTTDFLREKGCGLYFNAA